MTSEIAIMNKHSVAMATDSAVTMRHGTGEKIKTSANKLFALSKYHPIGIMVFGNADFMSIPWETIIKIYRNKLGRKKFTMLKEHADDFIAFLDNGNSLFPESIQKEYLLLIVYSYFNFIKNEIEKQLELTLNQKNEIDQDEIKEITSSIIKKHYMIWRDVDIIPSIPETNIKEIENKYSKDIETIIYKIFKKSLISKHHLSQLKEIAASLSSKFPNNIEKEGNSGVVIAGFGEKDIFPSLISFDIEGIVNNRLKYKLGLRDEITFENESSISSFARDEMVKTFMEGIDPFYKIVEHEYLSELFNKYSEFVIKTFVKENNEKIKKRLHKINSKILNEHLEKCERYRIENHILPVTNVVAMLPKDELAAMAEALVNLTSFALKVKLEPETVGGPIDVAVISKGDGFIWIKRKHYFNADLNPQFFVNYNKEEFINGDKIER